MPRIGLILWPSCTVVFDGKNVIAIGKPGVDGYYGPLFRGLIDGFAGHSVEIDTQYISTFECLDYFRSSGVDGLILVATPSHDADALQNLADAGVPFVAVSASSPRPQDQHLPCVDTANYAGGQIAARHLISLGHRRLACINLGGRFVNQADRMEGFQAAIAETCIPMGEDSLLIEFEYIAHEFEARIERWLNDVVHGNRLPTGIFACDYAMVEATLKVLNRQGIAVPEQVSVVGFDDPSSAATLDPPLTTVRQPVYEMGVRAARRLVSALETSSVPVGTEIFPTELVVRASTGRPRD